MNYWAVLIATVVGSFIVASVFSASQKKWLLPFCVAYTLGLVATVGSVAGVWHFAFTALNFVIVMCLCNGFRQEDWGGNPVWRAFMFFWVYMFAIVFTGYFPLEGACQYLHEFVKTFAAGYFFASWMCRSEGSLKRTLFAVLVAACFVIAYRISLGGLNADSLDIYGRAGLNADLLSEDVHENVNHVALTVACFLPFLMILLFADLELSCKWIVRSVAGAAFVGLLLLLIRTGARNGALALAPCVWYCLVASRQRGMVTRLILGGLIVAGAVVGVGITMRNAEILRSFDFLGEGQYKNYTGIEDRLTTGRWSMYANNIELLMPMEMAVGKGFTLTDDLWSFDKYSQQFYKQARITSGNAHSMFMTVFYRAGFVGLFLFLVFLLVALKQGFRCGDRGRMGLLFLGVWLATGVGESWGMTGGHTGILAGIGMGLLSRRRAVNPEFGETMPVDPCCYGYC